MFKPLGLPSQIKGSIPSCRFRVWKLNRTAGGGEEGGSNSRAIWIPVVLNTGKNLPVLISVLCWARKSQMQLPGELWARVILTRVSHPLAQLIPAVFRCHQSCDTQRGLQVTLSELHWAGKGTLIPAAAAPTFDAVP